MALSGTTSNSIDRYAAHRARLPANRLRIFHATRWRAICARNRASAAFLDDERELSRSGQTVASETRVIEGCAITSRRVVMLCESVVEVESAPTWTPQGRREPPPDWQTVDCALRTIARRRAALDADEAR
jgi:hypothetical protein